MQRLASFLPFFVASVALAGCSVSNNDCDVVVSVASSTAAESSAVPDSWTSSICTTDEKDLCHEQAPASTSLIHCAHDDKIVNDDRGDPTLGLECIFYRDQDKSCTDKHSHGGGAGGGWTLPGE